VIPPKCQIQHVLSPKDLLRIYCKPPSQHHRLKGEAALGNITVMHNNTRHAKEENLKQNMTTDRETKNLM